MLSEARARARAETWLLEVATTGAADPDGFHRLYQDLPRGSREEVNEFIRTVHDIVFGYHVPDALFDTVRRALPGGCPPFDVLILTTQNDLRLYAEGIRMVAVFVPGRARGQVWRLTASGDRRASPEAVAACVGGLDGDYRFSSHTGFFRYDGHGPLEGGGGGPC